MTLFNPASIWCCRIMECVATIRGVSPNSSVFIAALVGAIECPGGKLGYELRLSALVAVGTGCSAGGAAGDAVDVLAQVGTERFDCWMPAAIAVGDGRRADISKVPSLEVPDAAIRAVARDE
jgi:hypothetical protein